MASTYTHTIARGLSLSACRYSCPGTRSPNICLSAVLSRQFWTSSGRFTSTQRSFQGVLNGLAAEQPFPRSAVNAERKRVSCAIRESHDDPDVRQRYRPFLLPERIASSGWIADLEMSTVMKMAYEEMNRYQGARLKVLVLYGSLRERCGNICKPSSHSFVGLTSR